MKFSCCARNACLALILLVFSFRSYASEKVDENDPTIRALSENPAWYTLLGYTRADQSDIVDKAFFLHPEGNTSPFKELVATLSALSVENEVAETLNHPQCKYPARYMWLGKHLNLTKFGYKDIECSDYEKFVYQKNLNSISLIFATGYFGNPASYYGHLLLKLNSDEEIYTDLENTAVNFGARYPPNENMPTYIVKGVFGGYKSSFTHQQYYAGNLNYGEVDLRDLWEYKLDLQEEDRLLLVSHIWELIGVDYTYYFFNRNCAFRMAAVIQLVLDNKLTNNVRPWQTPQRLVQQLAQVEKDGHPLIKSVEYIPSRQSRLYQRFQALTKEEKGATKTVIKNFDGLDTVFDGLAEEEKLKVTDTLIDYYQYARTQEIISEEEFQSKHRVILAKRFLQLVRENDLTFNSHKRPEVGRKPSYVQVAAVNRNLGAENGANIKIRPAYYDTLDFSESHVDNSYLSMGEIDFRSFDDDWEIASIGIVKVENFNRNLTRLPGDKSRSWYVDTGLVNLENDNCESCLAIMADAGVGHSYSLFKNYSLVSFFLGGGFLGKKASEDNIFARARFNFHTNISSNLRFRVEASELYFVDDRNYSEFEFELRSGLTKNSDVRLIASKSNGYVQRSVAVGYYW